MSYSIKRTLKDSRQVIPHLTMQTQNPSAWIWREVRDNFSHLHFLQADVWHVWISIARLTLSNLFSSSQPTLEVGVIFT
jgi:hypothetical protein